MKDSNINEIEGLSTLISALHRLDGVLLNKGRQNYQERIHRIAKTIRSMTAHAYCVVSDFSLDDNSNKTLLELNSLSNYEELQSKLITENNLDNFNNDLKVNIEDDDFSMDLNDLLIYMEEELNNNSNKEKDNSSSDEENNRNISKKRNSTEDRDTDDNSKITKDDLKEHKQFQKKFLNIEKKLRNYLKKQIQNKMLDKNNFQTFIEQQRLKTPMVKSNKPNPSFIRNFFEESKDAMDKIKKKRISICQDKGIINNKMFSSINNNKLTGITPNTEKIKDFKNFNNKKDAKKISSFGLDNKQTNSNSNNNQHNEAKYFKCPYSYDNKGDYINEDPDELLDKNDIISENTEEDKSNSDEDSVYEEVEEEVEEEIEVEEDEYDDNTQPNSNNKNL